MLGHLIRKEILDHILGFRFLILSVLTALTVWLCLYSGCAYYLKSLRDYRLAEALTEERLRQLMVADDWHEIHARGYMVHKPPTPLSIFVRGLEPTLARSIPTGGGWILRMKLSQAEVDPDLETFPPLDLGLAVQIVLSLFVLLLTYDVVCGEKEGGTLRLMASFPVSRHQILLAKFVGAVIPTLISFGLPLLLGIAVLLQVPEVQLRSAEWMRLGIILGVFGIYLVAFACTGLFASCVAHRLATSFVILLAFWVAAVAVLPRLSLIVADGIRPAPSVHQHESTKDALGKKWYRTSLDRRRVWEENYHERTGEEWWKSPEGREGRSLNLIRWRQWAQERTQPDYDRLDEAFQNLYNARQDLAVVLARVSPTFALKNATVRLAGTGLDRQRRFLSVYARFRDQWSSWWRTTKDRDRLRKSHPAKYGQHKWDISNIPIFTYRETWPEEDVRAALVDIGILGLWALFFFLGAYVALLRFDVR